MDSWKVIYVKRKIQNAKNAKKDNNIFYLIYLLNIIVKS